MHSVTSYSQAVVGSIELAHAAAALLAPALFSSFMHSLGMTVRDDQLLLYVLFFAALGAHNWHDAVGLGPRSHAGVICQLGTYCVLGATLSLWSTGSIPRFLILPSLLLLATSAEYAYLHSNNAETATEASQSSPPRAKAHKKRTVGETRSEARGMSVPPPVEGAKAD
jgi:hypothetical protein